MISKFKLTLSPKLLTAAVALNESIKNESIVVKLAVTMPNIRFLTLR